MTTNLERIRQMTAMDWFNQAFEDEHLTPCLCFMCVGCDICEENCAYGIKQWLDKESEE